MDIEKQKFIKDRVKITKKGCWVTALKPMKNGYVSLTHKGKNYRSHRLSYEAYKGEIPNNLQIDHLCRNRLCVNPEHLEAVSQYVNIMRGIGPCSKNMKKTHCHRGHEFTIENTIMSKNPNGRPARICKKCQRIWVKNRCLRDLLLRKNRVLHVLRRV